MILSSPAFQDRKAIPTRYAHRGVTGGQNISFPLAWKDAPAGTGSFALSIVDPHPVARNWVHWLIINLPKDLSQLPEGASGHLPSGAKELYNSFGEPGYGGPQPPRGSGPHPYETTLYALRAGKLDLAENATLGAFQKSLEGIVLASARITGIYEQ